MAVTQKDIANHVGLSPQAVAHALNGVGRLRPETRERILKAAHELGYRPNPMARALVTGKTNLVALWIRNLSSFEIAVTRHVESLIGASSYDLIINNINIARKSDETMVKPAEATVKPALPAQFAAAEWPSDGILSLDSSIVPDWISQRSDITRTPLVCMGNSFACDTNVFDKVTINLRPASQNAVQHLAKGRQRVAYMAARTLLWREAEPRLSAYLEVMREAGRPPEIIEVPRETDIRAASYRTIKNYVAQNGAPCGIFCGNDDYALGALRGLHELGLRVPDDVALVGCDGISDSEYSIPALSTIVQPIDEMCRTAWEFLQKRMDDPAAPRQVTELTARFEQRESS